MSAIIGRFAPTPSGRMHLGNAYAMLSAWLSARASNGRILLRIEDIDQPRVRPDADRWIMDDLHWLGLDWDDEPIYQSQRLDRYEEALRVLRGCDMRSFDSISLAQDDATRDVLVRDDVRRRAVALGTATSVAEPKASTASPLIYPCFCSRAEIRAASAPQEGDGFVRYPGTCRRLDPAEREVRLNRGDRHSWRIAVPEGIVHFDDRVFGSQTVDLARELGDTVVRRSDGIFSYQLAVTVDDLEMGVTDVVRGRDLLRSTALQMWIRANLLAAGFGMVAQGSPNHPNQDGGIRDDVTEMRAGDAFPSSSAQSSMPSIDDLVDNGMAFSQALEMSAQADDARPTSAQPAYAHLPLIDDETGKRLAKRDRALDLGVLRDQGVTPEQVVGRCAWWLGLQVDAAGTPLPEPVPMSAAEALGAFSWNRVRAAHDRDHGDYRMR